MRFSHVLHFSHHPRDPKRGNQAPSTTAVPLLFVGFFPTTNNYTREYSNLVTVIKKSTRSILGRGLIQQEFDCCQQRRNIISNSLLENLEKPYPKATCPFS